MNPMGSVGSRVVSAGAGAQNPIPERVASVREAGSVGLKSRDRLLEARQVVAVEQGSVLRE